MKKIFFFLAVMISLAACKSSDKKATPAQLTPEEKAKALTDTANFTTIQWLDSTYKDLGKLKPDQTVEITYRFKNSGTKNLIIDNVSAQCGCTIPEKPEKAFAPGEEGLLKAKFNGSGKGQIRKEIYLTANTKPENAYTLSFGGEIISQ